MKKKPLRTIDATEIGWMIGGVYRRGFCASDVISVHRTTEGDKGMQKNPLEKQVQKKIVDYLKTLAPDLWYYSTTGNLRGRAGVPDVVGCYCGKFFAIEVKRPIGKGATPLQKNQIQQINDADGLAFVARSVAFVKEVLESDSEHRRQILESGREQ